MRHSLREAELLQEILAVPKEPQGGLLLTQVRRDPHQLRTALNAARNNLRLAAT